MTTEWTLREEELPVLPPHIVRPHVFAPDPGADGRRGGNTRPDSVLAVQEHLDNVIPALESLRGQAYHLAAWGEELARRLLRGQRLLAAGNGGSAAEAQHLTAELVGRFDGERVPFSAISLHAETSAVTAIANDYGFEELYARQVRAHGRSGDVLILLSTSGKSPNLLRAADVATRLNITTWALTGPAPNPLASRCDEAVTIQALSANAQEGHLIALHAMCRAFDAEVARRGRNAACTGSLP
ncbi:phosphoheptose isomerase [Arthrobacter sp. FB24]|uniref:D-sedoheptulose-7-phosphate isomerase n=1 Tax=Arthrobacter sp. (strain FB24) TaxID=290399 RepID=UPI000052749C|nr:SIS domain-containing protein [Arthrobacter sp. FB24]ABK01757.1 phosphoheptose isomerase [Arthrobacter sp. FB24]